MTNRLFSLIFFCLITVSGASAKDTPVEIVQSYNFNLTEFLKEGDVEYLDRIDVLLRGGDVKCVINNSLAKEFARAKKWNNMTMHSDTYHNELINRREDGVISSVKLSQYEWLKDWVEPRIKISDKEIPVLFVAATTEVDGLEHESFRDLFFIRGENIVKIDDLSDSESLGRALELYNAKDYRSAFRIFRKLANASRNAREAQYYYAVMLIKGQGCDDMAKKVRDMEAAWVGLAGFKAGDEDLSSLAQKFSMSITGSTFEQIWQFRPSVNGRRIWKKKDSYGIMDDNGKMILPYRAGYCLPLSSDGYAAVSADGKKYGLMDSDGNQIIPYEYDNINSNIVNDKFMAVKDNKLYILSKTGVPLKIIDGDYLFIPYLTEGNLALVVSKGKMELYDFDGNIVDDSFYEITQNYREGLLILKRKDEDKPYAEHLIKW